MLEIFLDALLDGLKMLPLLFVTYILIELVERKTSFAKNGKFLSGKGAPLFGALAGSFPQCGVSVMAAKLFERGLIGVGTLLSVFIATSDEAFSILIASDKRLALLPLIGGKFLFAVIVGYVMNAIFRVKTEKPDEDETYNHEEVCAHCHDHVVAEGEGKYSWIGKYVLVPLFHALQTFLYVFLVMWIFGIFFSENGVIGAAALEKFLSGSRFFTPFLSVLIGLIPNCASSAVLTAAYLKGAISFASLFAGLSVNAGVGMAILFRDTKQTKRNLLLLVFLYVLGSLAGLAIELASSLF